MKRRLFLVAPWVLFAVIVVVLSGDRIGLWVGAAAMAALYACGYWVLHLDKRGQRWIKTGRCGVCGYDLRGSPAGGACPECGAGSALERDRESKI